MPAVPIDDKGEESVMREKMDALRQKILNRPACIVLLFLPFFEPIGLENLFVPLYWVFFAWRLLSIAAAVVFFLVRPRLSAGTAVIGVYQAVLMVSTLVNGVDYHEWLFKAALTAGMCLLMDQCMDVDARALVKGLFFTLGGLCLANLATVLLFPGGMAGLDIYLLASDNVHAAFIIPAMAMALLYGGAARWPVAVQALLLAAFASSLFITWSVTGMVGVTACLALFLLLPVPKSYRLCNVLVYYAAIAAVFVLLVFCWTPDRFAGFLQNVLHKNVMTLSGRTGVWDRVIQCIAEKPLLGHGKLRSLEAVEVYGGYHCHNLLLQTAFDTGAVGCGVFAAQMGLLARPLWRTRSTRSGYILAAALCAMLLYFMSEGQLYAMPYICILMCCFHAEDVTAALEPGAESE